MTPAEWREDLASFDVHDTASAEMFLYACERHIGLGFHPDIPGDDYVNASGYTFTPEQAIGFDRALQACFVYLDDPYEVSLAECQRLNPEIFGAPAWPFAGSVDWSDDK